MNKLHHIANTNGLSRIKEKMVEELHELIEAIESNDATNIVEESADVRIMISQYLYTTQQEAQCEEVIEYKIDRTINKIEKGEKI